MSTPENVAGDSASVPAIGRNEPCPCGSHKKYKRCCGIDAAPKLSLPKIDWSKPAPGANSPAVPAGFDPSQMDPQMIAQFSQMLQRLPRGQMQKLQSIMQRAMAGKDVSREAEDFERSLPPDFQQAMLAMKIPGMGAPGADIAADASPADLTPEAARKIIEEARAKGDISEEQAEQLLGGTTGELAAGSEAKPEGAGFNRFWKNITGKKNTP